MTGKYHSTKSASRVNLDHFDPEGVRELSRSLSQSSAQARERSLRSDRTLAPEEPFSLEKKLRTVLDRYEWLIYVPLGSSSWGVSHKIDRQHDSDVKRRELGVYFKDLRVTGVGATVSHQATIGSMFNPKVILEESRGALRPSTRTILHDFNGVIKPGEMLREFIR